jgi:predicted dehydrogenase
MVHAIRSYGCIFQHGTQRRCFEAVRTACELVRSGRIGKATHAVVTVGPGPKLDFPDYATTALPPDPEVFDWDMWLGPAPWRPFGSMTGWHREYASTIWQQHRDFGLRSIGNWGSHTLDMVQWALDKDEQTPVEIIPPRGGDDALALKYADGITIFCPRTPGDSMDASVFGTEGRKIIFGKPQIEEKCDRTPLGPGDVKLYRAENDDYYGNWLHCMRTRKKTICNEEVAYRSGMLCVLIAMADRLKRPFKYDPQKLQCAGDDEANRLLDTPKRAPWRVY